MQHVRGEVQSDELHARVPLCQQLQHVAGAAAQVQAPARVFQAQTVYRGPLPSPLAAEAYSLVCGVVAAGDGLEYAVGPIRPFAFQTSASGHCPHKGAPLGTQTSAPSSISA